MTPEDRRMRFVEFESQHEVGMCREAGDHDLACLGLVNEAARRETLDLASLGSDAE